MTKIDKPLADFRSAHKAKEDARKAMLAAQHAHEATQATFATAEEDYKVAHEKFFAAAIKP